MNTSDRLTFLGILRSEDVAMYLDARGNLRSRGPVQDPEIAGFIRAYRADIIRELNTTEPRSPK